MLITVLIVFLAALVLSGLLWAGTLFLQSWLYETPTGDLYWRLQRSASAWPCSTRFG